MTSSGDDLCQEKLRELCGPYDVDMVGVLEGLGGPGGWCLRQFSIFFGGRNWDLEGFEWVNDGI